MRPEAQRPDVPGSPVVGSGTDAPGIDVPDVPPGRFAHIMSAQGEHVLERFIRSRPPRGERPRNLHTSLRDYAQACQAPQVDGSLSTTVAQFTLGFIQGLQGNVVDETAEMDEPFEYDSDDTSDGGYDDDTLEQKKVLKH